MSEPTISPGVLLASGRSFRAIFLFPWVIPPFLLRVQESAVRLPLTGWLIPPSLLFVRLHSTWSWQPHSCLSPSAELCTTKQHSHL